jgi:hypothetical protein
MEKTYVVLKCPRCSYVWLYAGSRKSATCPRCRSKISVKKYAVTVINEHKARKILEILGLADTDYADTLIRLAIAASIYIARDWLQLHGKPSPQL